LPLAPPAAANRAAGSQVEELSSAKAELAANLEQAAAEKEQLVPQLEQARWQNRQLEKKLEEAAAAKSHAEQVRRYGSNSTSATDLQTPPVLYRGTRCSCSCGGMFAAQHVQCAALALF
jgi:uncharacterized membrane protein YccC